MFYLEKLKPGEKFKAAMEITSMNGRPVPTDKVMVVTKVYVVPPKWRIAKLDGFPELGIYSLLPNTVVIYPEDPPIDRTKVLRFVSYRNWARYELLWDGVSELGIMKHGKILADLWFHKGPKAATFLELRKFFYKELSRILIYKPANCGRANIMAPPFVVHYGWKALTEAGLVRTTSDSDVDSFLRYTVVKRYGDYKRRLNTGGCRQ